MKFTIRMLSGGLLLGAWMMGGQMVGYAEEILYQEDFEQVEIGQVPDGLEVVGVQDSAELNQPEQFGGMVEVNPDMQGDVNPSSHVFFLKDASRGEEHAGIKITDLNFSQGTVAFKFYTSTAARNGALLVRLVNAEGQVLASFALYTTGHELGHIHLNALGNYADRVLPGTKDLYMDKTWHQVELEYDGVGMKWSLRWDAHEFKDLNSDARIIQTDVYAVEIFTGFEKASQTTAYIDDIEIKKTGDSTHE